LNDVSDGKKQNRRADNDFDELLRHVFLRLRPQVRADPFYEENSTCLNDSQRLVGRATESAVVAHFHRENELVKIDFESFSDHGLFLNQPN
jgi:hypothetical protein